MIDFPSSFLFFSFLFLSLFCPSNLASWPQAGGNSLQNRLAPSGTNSSSFLTLSNGSPSLLFNISLPASLPTTTSDFSPCGAFVWAVLGNKKSQLSYLIGISPSQGEILFNYSIPASYGDFQGDIVCNEEMIILTLANFKAPATLLAMEIPSDGPAEGLLVEPFNPIHIALADSLHLAAIPIAWHYTAPAYGNVGPKIYEEKYLFAQFNTTMTVLQIESGNVLATLDVFPIAKTVFNGSLNSDVNVPFFNSFQWKTSSFHPHKAAATNEFDRVELWVVVQTARFSTASPALIVLDFHFSTLQFNVINSYLISSLCPTRLVNNPSWAISSIWGDEKDPEQRVMMAITYSPVGFQDPQTNALLALGMPRSNIAPIFVFSPRNIVYPFRGGQAQLTSTVLLPDFSLAGTKATKKHQTTHSPASAASYGGPSSFIYLERTLAYYMDDCDAPLNISIYSIVSKQFPSSSGGSNQTIRENWRIPLPNAYSSCGYAVLVYSLSQMNSHQAFFRWNSLFTKQNPPPFGASAWRIDLNMGDYEEIVDYSPGWSYIAGSPTFVLGSEENQEVSYGFEPAENYGYSFPTTLQGWKWS